MTELGSDIVTSREELDHRIFYAATRFTVVMMLGAGKKDKEEFKTLPEAIERAKTWKGPRRPLVYAVTPQGRSCPLDRVDWPQWLSLWKEPPVVPPSHKPGNVPLKELQVIRRPRASLTRIAGVGIPTPAGPAKAKGIPKSDPFYIPDFLNRAKWSPERWKAHAKAMAKAAEEDRERLAREAAERATQHLSLNAARQQPSGKRLRGKAREELAFKVQHALGADQLTKKALLERCQGEMPRKAFNSGLRRAVKLKLILKERAGRHWLFINPRARPKAGVSGAPTTLQTLTETGKVKTPPTDTLYEQAKPKVARKKLMRKSLQREGRKVVRKQLGKHK